jgi:hypothetical protein
VARRKQDDGITFKTSLDPGSVSEPAAATPGTQITTPAVPATTVTATNGNAVGVWVTLPSSDSTVTAVKVNGATVGTGPGTYWVPAGQTIALTYASGSPTWTWYAPVSVDPGTHTFTGGAAQPGD